MESDHKKRPDLITLKSGDIKNAQKEKEIHEEIQRRDAKLRKENEKVKEKAAKKWLWLLLKNEWLIDIDDWSRSVKFVEANIRS